MSLLEQRKVTKVGYGTIAITIPKKWAEKLGIRPGSTVTLLFDEYTQSIIIRKQGTPRSEDNILIENGDVEELVYKIKGGYISGADKIIIFKNNVKDNEINNLAEKLPGLLILSDTEHTIIRIALLDDIIDINDVIRRIKNIILTIMNNLLEYLKTRRNEINRTLTLYEEIDKMYLLGLRYLSRVSRQPTSKIHVVNEYIYLAIILEKLRNIKEVLHRLTETILDGNREVEITPTHIKLLEESKHFLINVVETIISGNDPLKVKIAIKHWKNIVRELSVIREKRSHRDLELAIVELNNVVNSLLETIMAYRFSSGKKH